MKRRDFVGLAMTAPAVAGIAPRNLDRIKTRTVGKVETVFKSPGSKPNGLQATREGLWILDQGNNKVYLVNYSDGAVIREFNTESDRGSGLTFDGEALWLGSTYNREIVRCDATTGKTLTRFFTPGAGVIYKTTWDPPARSSPLAKPPAGSRREAVAAARYSRAEYARHRRARTGVERWQALDGRSSFENDLSYRPEDLDRGTTVPDRRQSASWHRLGREISLVHGFEPERVLQTRHRDWGDRGEDSACRVRSSTPWHEYLARPNVVLR